MTARLTTMAAAAVILCFGVPASADEIGVGFTAPTQSIQTFSVGDRQLVKIQTPRGETVVVKDRTPDRRRPSIVEYD
jgi:hypothetical protein